MEGWSANLPRLDVRSHFNMTLNASAVREVPWTQTNTTRRLIASLQLQQVQTLRTTHLTIGAFSLALTLLTVYRIVSDARRVAALQATPTKRCVEIRCYTWRVTNCPKEVQRPLQCSFGRDFSTCPSMWCGYPANHIRISAEHVSS
jgi:hypothetical protein